MYFKNLQLPTFSYSKAHQQKFNIQLLYNQVMSQRGKQNNVLFIMFERSFPRYEVAPYFRI